MIISAVIVIPCSFANEKIFSNVFPSSKGQLKILAKDKIFASLILSKFTCSIFSFQRLPLRFVINVLSPSSVTSPILMDVFKFGSIVTPSVSILSSSQERKMNAPAASSPIAAIRPVLHPRRLMIVDSFIASPPTAIAMLSTGYDSISKTSLDTGRSGISTTAAPRHNTSNFFSTLFISPSVITK